MSFHEVLAADEGTRFEQYAAELTALQRARSEKSGNISRALHVKQHLGAVGGLSRFSFDPWHAIEAHRPLGAIMRARAVAYRESVLARKAESEPHSVLSV
jgi:hypothetical protein